MVNTTIMNMRKIKKNQIQLNMIYDELGGFFHPSDDIGI